MLVGREREIALIEGAFSDVASGCGALFAIVGEAGIGKTRLCDELTRRAAAKGFRVHWGRAWETGGAPAYWPWTQILESIARTPDAPAMPEAALPVLARRPGPAAGEFVAGDSAQARFALFDAVSTYLQRAAEIQPMLLVVDDAHVADEPSIDLACFAAAATRSTRVLLLVTARQTEAASAGAAPALARLTKQATPVTLGRLSASQVSVLLSTMVPDHAERWAAEIFRLTEGNPLFVHEMLRALLARPAGADPAALASLPVLHGAAVVIRERLERLSPSARVVIDLAAVIGREVPLELLESLAQDLDLRGPLQELVASGLLVEAGPSRYLFNHVLVREALYRGLGPDKRRGLHAALAGLLAEGAARGHAAAIESRAHHALLALPLIEPAEAARACIAAAEHARAQLAYEEAITWLERARDQAAPDGRTMAEVLLMLGWALADAGRSSEQLAAFERAASIARRLEDPRLLARAALGYGAHYVFGDVMDPLVSLLREALGSLPVGEVNLRARLEGRLAAALTPAAVPDEALALARAAVSRARERADLRTMMEVAVSAGSAMSGFAPPAEAGAINEELIRVARMLSDRVLELRGLWRLVVHYLEQGEVARADALLPEIEALGGALKLPRYAWQIHLLRSMRAMIEGRFDVCRAAFEQARELGRATDDGNLRRCLAVHRFHVALLADDVEALVASEADALAAVSGMSGAASVQDVFAAAVAARRGDVVRARAALERLVVSDFRYVRAPPFLATCAETAVLLGDDAAAARIYDFLVPAVDWNPAFGLFALTCGPPGSSSLGALAALLGRTSDAHAYFERALARTHSMRAAAHEVWVRFAFGRALVTHLGDAERGRDELDRASALAEDLGMQHLARRARAALGPAISAPPSSPRITFTLRKENSRWVVARGDRTFTLRDLRGMSMLARLIENAGQELHVTQLVGSAGDGESVPIGDAGELIDARARKAYQQRLEALRDTQEEAERFGDTPRATRAREEIEALEAELARAVGLGGRGRRAGSAVERARITVQRRVREAIARIGEQDEDLGRHLDFSIRTGAFCIYDPDARRR